MRNIADFGYHSFETIVVTRLNYDHPMISISAAFLSASKNNQLRAEFSFFTYKFSNSLTFPDDWRIIYIP